MDFMGSLLLILLVGVAVLVVVLYRKLEGLASRTGEMDEEKARSIVNQVFGEISNKVILQTKGALSSEKEAIFKDNENKAKAIEKMVAELKTEIDERQKEIRGLEQDRNKKFGEITTAIEEHRKITEELKTSTQSLSKVLSNNQTRGQWGERIIEDILQSAGLMEGVHFLRQATLGSSSVKPDITILLPNQRKVCVDVKFPYAEIQKMALAEGKTAKAEHLKNFSRDVRKKIGEIETRGYIDVEHGTLDYAIMFVPNEMLFSFINQQLPDVVDEAMDKKVMMVSPFTFLIVARTVMESYRNFMMENNLKTIVKHITEFVDDWKRFQGEFGKFDESIESMRKRFDQIYTTRYKQMDLRIKRIQEDQQEKLIEEGQPLLKG